MFSFNEALASIVAAESDVVAVYRSVASAMAAPEGRREQPCDAFICVVSEEGGERIYVAIHLRSDMKTLVYTPVSTAGITDAMSFLERYGFRMENCNLGFSTALREVIIRSIGVISPPGADRSVSPGGSAGISLTGAEKTAGPATPAQAPPAGGAAAAEIGKLQAEWEKVLRERDALLEGERERHAEELARIATERDSRKEEAAAELATARAELASLSEDFEALRAEYQLINEELTARNDDLNRLRDEMQEGEKKSAAQKLALTAELQKAREAKDAAARTAAAQLAQLKATVEQLSASGSGAPAASGASPIDKVVADLAGGSAQSVELFPAASAAAGEEGELNFRLDRSITAITYAAGDDIIEIHASINAAQMNPPGGKAESSLAWVCGIERNGSPRIYIAFYLNESGRALIHVPDRQPASLAAYGRGIRSAIAYVETIGFMMEALPIANAAERMKLLQEIPVFEL